MIEYDNIAETMDMTCDECYSNDIFDGTWQDGIYEAKKNGWIIFKNDNDEWLHFCSTDCRNEYMD